jgi:hypothetical protein
MDRELSRRSFIAGAALAGGLASGVAAFGLAGCSPTGDDTGTSANETPTNDTPATGEGGELSPAAGQPKGYLCVEDWLGIPPVIDNTEIKETISVDVVVLGSGHAGTQAALAAAQSGAKVAVVEEQEKETYMMFGEDLATFNSDFLTRRGFGGYNLGEIVSEFVRRSQGNILTELIKSYVENSGEMLDNLISILPAESNVFDIEGGQCAVQICYGKNSSTDYPVIVGGLKSWASSIRTLGTAATYPVDGREGVSRMTEIEIYSRLAAEELGAVWYFGHKATVLTQGTDGEITGAIAQDASGAYVKFEAAKGVIIACGDFSGNADMVYNLIDAVNESNVRLGKTREDMGSMGRDGSGIKLGCWAGGYIEPHPRGSMNNNSAVPGSFGAAPLLVLNNDGKRFFNEALSEYGSACLMRQPKGLFASIMDSKYAQSVTGGSCDHGAADFGVPFFWEQAQEDMEAAAGTGAAGSPVTNMDILSLENPSTSTVFAGETIEEVLGYLGYAGGALDNAVVSIKRYNELCAKGTDEDFGKDGNLMVSVDTPPFYGFVRENSGARGTGLVTVCGLVTNEGFEVLNEDRSGPIGELYAVGNSLGQRYGGIYVMPIAGNSIGMAMTHGRVVGKLLGAS